MQINADLFLFRICFSFFCSLIFSLQQTHTHTPNRRGVKRARREKNGSRMLHESCTDTAQSGYWLPKVFYFIYITLQLSLCVLIHYDRLALMPSIFVARLLPLLLLLLRRRRLLLLFTLQFTVLLARDEVCANGTSSSFSSFISRFANFSMANYVQRKTIDCLCCTAAWIEHTHRHNLFLNQVSHVSSGIFNFGQKYWEKKRVENKREKTKADTRSWMWIWMWFLLLVSFGVQCHVDRSFQSEYYQFHCWANTWMQLRPTNIALWREIWRHIHTNTHTRQSTRQKDGSDFDDTMQFASFNETRLLFAVSSCFRAHTLTLTASATTFFCENGKM